MEYDETRFDNYDLIGTIGVCDYCGHEIYEGEKIEVASHCILHIKCFVWYCLDRDIVCKDTKNVKVF